MASQKEGKEFLDIYHSKVRKHTVKLNLYETQHWATVKMYMPSDTDHWNASQYSDDTQNY